MNKKELIDSIKNNLNELKIFHMFCKNQNDIVINMENEINKIEELYNDDIQLNWIEETVQDLSKLYPGYYIKYNDSMSKYDLLQIKWNDLLVCKITNALWEKILFFNFI